MEEYRDNYPQFQPLPSNADQNLQFYANAITSQPNGATITEMHAQWAADYGRLESHHGYIQWLFPLRERSRFNAQAQVLQPHEMLQFTPGSELQLRFYKTLQMMLNFWGMQIVDTTSNTTNAATPTNANVHLPRTIRVDRCIEWKDRLWNTRQHSHNNMRLTRMLKCCGELGFERYKLPIVRFLIHECFGEHAFLSNCACVSSCRDYWVKTLRNDQERAEMEQLIEQLETATWRNVPTEAMVQPLEHDNGDIGRCVNVCWNAADDAWRSGRIVLVGRVPRKGNTIRHKIAFNNGQTKIYILGQTDQNEKGEKEFTFMTMNRNGSSDHNDAQIDAADEGEHKQNNPAVLG